MAVEHVEAARASAEALAAVAEGARERIRLHG
jgi:hypothetical protein